MGSGTRFTNADILRLQQKGITANDPIIDTKLKKAFGLPTKRTYTNKEKDHIEFTLIALSLKYNKEFKFCAWRKYKFDYAIPDVNIYIEYEGIYSSKSGHTTMDGYSSNCEKYNLATIMEWKGLRYTSKNYMSIYDDLIKLLSTCK